MTAEPTRPLPRRAGRSHLEPQLREPWSAGDGTPFTAFDPADGDDEVDAEPPGPVTGDRPDFHAKDFHAKEFHDGTERGRAEIS